MPQKADERTTSLYQVTIKDQTGTGITQSKCSSFKVTVFNFDDDAKTAINNRNAQEQASAFSGDITINASGVVSFKMQAADNQILGARAIERHGLIFDITLTTGERIVWEDEIRVENKDKVT